MLKIILGLELVSETSSPHFNLNSEYLKLEKIFTNPFIVSGKTLLARAVAHHTECTFIRVSGSELVQKFIGEGSRMVRELFVMAR